MEMLLDYVRELVNQLLGIEILDLGRLLLRCLKAGRACLQILFQGFLVSMWNELLYMNRFFALATQVHPR